jgi:hypothetical protein
MFSLATERLSRINANSGSSPSGCRHLMAAPFLVVAREFGP